MNDDEKRVTLPSIYMRITKSFFINFTRKTPKIGYLSIQLGKRSQTDLEITHTCERKGVSTMIASSNIDNTTSRN